MVQFSGVLDDIGEGAWATGPAGAELFLETGPMLARDWQGPKQKPIPGQAQARADCPLAAETCAPHGMLPDPLPRRPGL